MNALIVYESMFGNTRKVAEAIARALESASVDVTLKRAADAPKELAGYELIVVGAPTHAHTLPQSSSRKEAFEWARDPEKSLALEPDSQRPGVREWLATIVVPDPKPRFAGFSTRVDIARIFAGDASAAIKRQLRKREIDLDAHEDFLVDFDSRLVAGEEQRAQAWATGLVPVASR